MQVRILGRVDIRNDDGEPIVVRQRKLRQLVCVLVLIGEPVPSEQLQSMLWDSANQSRLSALTTTVNKLRNLLPDGRIRKDHAGYRLVLHDEDYLDVREFRAHVSEARRVRRAEPHMAADLYERAIGIWADAHLLDIPDTPVVTARARLLFIERRDATEALAGLWMALGRHARAVRELPMLLESDPLNDHLWLFLLLAQYRDGRKGEALRTFAEVRATYLAKTGAEPSVPLKTMRDRIAHDDPGLRWRPELAAHEVRRVDDPVAATHRARGRTPVLSPARAYDYLLGGTNNFDVDRQAAEQVLAVAPDLRESAHDCRRFLRTAVRLLAERGICQFVDIGAGLPAYGSVHEVAREVEPDVRVVYVDRDPMVVTQSRVMVNDCPNVAFIVGDLLRPVEILSNAQTRRLINPADPTAVLMLQVLHFIPADSAHEVLETYRTWMAPGSALAISHLTRDGSDPRAIRAVQEVQRQSGIRIFQRSLPEIESMFAGLELLGPLDAPGNWQATERTPDRRLRHLAGVAFRTG